MIDEPTTQSDSGPSACPFVAFGDDRDHRSSSPDYRHRCFAAAEPEPRAFPHQERYCLSGDFSGCPVFLDWARQEAAAVKVNADSTPAGVAMAAGAMAAGTMAAGTMAAVGAEDETAPAFLNSRMRPAGDLVSPADRRTVEAGATLWTYDTENRRSHVPPAPPPPSSLGAPAVAMARRGPSHPGWENPPRLENFPRLRSRDERRANEPLLVAAVGIALIMVALILFPILTSPKIGGLAGGGGGGTQASIASGPVTSPTPQGSPTPTAAPTLPDGYFKYRVLPGDFTLKIAQKFNLQIWELELANPQIKDFALIQAGQVMLIPPPNLLTEPPSSGNP